MYYSSGNYEAFARPEKPEGVDHKSLVRYRSQGSTQAWMVVHPGSDRVSRARPYSGTASRRPVWVRSLDSLSALSNKTPALPEMLVNGVRKS